jgi:hypothetical protein
MATRGRRLDHATGGPAMSTAADRQPLYGRTALITGATGGIGYETRIAK